MELPCCDGEGCCEYCNDWDESETPESIAVITGGRDYGNEVRFFEGMDELHARYAFTKVAAGDATGVDELTEAWCRKRRVPFEKFLADWKADGRAAGPIRNARMLRMMQPQLVIAWPGGRGTADCVRKARAMLFEVIEIN